MTKLVLDASIIISWCEELKDLKIMEELGSLGYDFIVPEEVVDELSDNEMTASVLEEASIEDVDQDQKHMLGTRYPMLGSGELAVMVLGKSLEKDGEDYLCVIDDGVARKKCENMGLNRTGTIGLFKTLHHEEVYTLTECGEMVDTMKENGTRLPSNSLELIENPD